MIKDTAYVISGFSLDITVEPRFAVEKRSDSHSARMVAPPSNVTCPALELCLVASSCTYSNVILEAQLGLGHAYDDQFALAWRTAFACLLCGLILVIYGECWVLRQGGLHKSVLHCVYGKVEKEKLDIPVNLTLILAAIPTLSPMLSPSPHIPRPMTCTPSRTFWPPFAALPSCSLGPVPCPTPPLTPNPNPKP